MTIDFSIFQAVSYTLAGSLFIYMGVSLLAWFIDACKVKKLGSFTVQR